MLNQQIITRTTSGRRNLYLPMGGAEKLQRFRRDKDNLVGKIFAGLGPKDLNEADQQSMAMARAALTSWGASHGYRKMEDMLKFDDEPLSMRSFFIYFFNV